MFSVKDYIEKGIHCTKLLLLHIIYMRDVSCHTIHVICKFGGFHVYLRVPITKLLSEFIYIHKRNAHDTMLRSRVEMES